MDFLTCVFCFYLEVGAGYKAPFDTSEKVFEVGSNPTAHLAIGVTRYFGKYNLSLDLKYEHVSHWTDGFPIDKNDEWQLGQFKIVARKYLNN